MIEVLESLVHELQNFGRTGVDALANLVQAGAAQQCQVFKRQPCGQIGGGLDAPLEVGAGANQALGNPRARSRSTRKLSSTTQSNSSR